jgi:hypothetical protein
MQSLDTFCELYKGKKKSGNKGTPNPGIALFICRTFRYSSGATLPLPKKLKEEKREYIINGVFNQLAAATVYFASESFVGERRNHWLSSYTTIARKKPLKHATILSITPTGDTLLEDLISPLGAEVTSISATSCTAAELYEQKFRMITSLNVSPKKLNWNLLKAHTKYKGLAFHDIPGPELRLLQAPRMPLPEESIHDAFTDMYVNIHTQKRRNKQKKAQHKQ